MVSIETLLSMAVTRGWGEAPAYWRGELMLQAYGGFLLD